MSIFRRQPLASRLLAPVPGWTTDTDVVIVGSGIAGLSLALQARRNDLRVLVVTKTVLAAGATQWAQGGIAVAVGPEDTTAEHESDTLIAGVGLCDLEAVHV